MQLNVLKSDGLPANEVDVADGAFTAPFNEGLIHQVVTAYQAGGRAGTRAQRDRSAVCGGGTKPYRQKGTGRARAGTIRSPIWRGGGKVFPATTRDYSQKVNRKMYRSAMRSILSELVRQERLVVVDGFAIDEPKTKLLAEKLDTLNGLNALIVTETIDENLVLSARNLPDVDVCTAGEIDPVSLIAYEKIICTLPALKKIEQVLA